MQLLHYFQFKLEEEVLEIKIKICILPINLSIPFMFHLIEDEVNHLYLHCPVAAGIWSMYFAVFGTSWSTQLTQESI